MKKRILSLLLCCVMLLGLVPTAVFAEGSTVTADITGEGTAENPYLIYTAAGLKEFRDIVNGENGKIKKSDAHAKLMNDIVLNDGMFDADGNYTPGASGKAAEEWTPIGKYYNPYSGTFDGGGHTIKELYVKDQQYAGLFGCVRSDCYVSSGSDFTVKDLTVTGYIDTNCKDDVYAGGIIGYAKIIADEGNAVGTISDCVNNVTVKARSIGLYAYAGGIVGYAVFDNNNGTGNMEIINCANNAAVTAHSEKHYAYAGGIEGYIDGYGTSGDSAVQKINTCFNSGPISDSNSSPNSVYAGGILGHNIGNYFTDISVDNCLNVGEVIGATDSIYVGGIVGNVEKTSVSNCCNVGKIGGNGGGIAGNMINSPVSNCYYLKGTAKMAYNGTGEECLKNKAEFADGTVLRLLQNGNINSPWTKCGYLESAKMVLPMFEWQTADVQKYDISVADNDGKAVQITALNKDDVLGDGKVSFEYDLVNDKGILTLNGANLISGTDFPIHASKMENLEIVLKGENKIEAELYDGITADNLTFSGEGSIEISTEYNFNRPVSCDRTFTVNGGNVKISGFDYALCLDGALTVNGGTLELIAPGEYGHAIDIGFNDLNVVLADDRIMITGTNPDGSDARITAASEVDTVKAARYVKILSKYIPIVYEPGLDGTGSAVTQNKTYGEDFNLAGALFTRIGYKQIGWALSDGGDKTYELGSAYTGNKPLTLYPVWEAEQYSITYNPGGGTIGSGNVTGYTYGVGATLPTDVTRTGYTFDGWYDNAELEGTAVTSISDTDSGNKTYYAKWTENSNYIVIFISNGGTLANDKKTVKWTDKVLDGVADPTRNGHIFAGWKYVDTDVTSDTTYADLAVNDTVISVTLTAQWRDIAAPTGEIKIAENGWKTFLNNITFGLFFKDTQTVTVTAADNSGEAVTIEYLLSDKALTENELAGMTFTAYSAPLSINPDNEYVIYAKLTDTSRNVAYINTTGIVLDATVPVISGIEADKTYCAAQTVTVTEKYINTVTVNGTEISLDENGRFVLSPASGEQTIVVTDRAGNETRVTVTVNNGHTYEWQSENGQYWQKCKFCGDETAKKDIPTINISGADKVCRTQDYKFSFTLPEGATDAAYGYEFIGLGDGPLTPSVEDNLYSGILKATIYPAEENSFKLIVSAKTADGFEFSAEKTVAIQNEHTGGTATCTDKAICETCGESYGELNANNHADMKHIDAKAATKTAEGNTEYWYCEDCNKYFADKDGAKEITKADTVTAKLPEEKPTSPKTGDTSNLALWIALLFISGGAVTATTIISKKKKHSKE